MGEVGTSNGHVREIANRADDGVGDRIDSDRMSHLERNDSNLSAHSITSQTPSKIQLQLVLPSQYGINDDPHGFDTMSGVHRRSRPPSRTGSIQSKSPGFVNTRLVNYNRGLSHQPSVLSQRPPTVHHENIPPPSTEEEKSKMTRRYFATLAAIMYAIFLVIFAIIAFVGNEFYPISPTPEIFCIIILCIGICYFIFLYIDIRLHVKKATKAVKEREERMRHYDEQMARLEENFQSSLEMRRAPNGNINVQVPIPELTMAPIKPISHRYCFASGRHGEFLYLKVGAAWFCFGLLIHSILSLSYQAIYFIEDPECADPLQLTVDILFPIHSLIVLFFIFKYINIIINSYRGVARLLLMHAIGTTLAFWIYTIVRETVDAINMKRNGNYTEDPLMDVRMERLTEAVKCPGDGDMNTIRRTFSPYLYPFVIEFCILIVGIFYMMWAHINHCPKKLSAQGHGHGHHDSGHGGGHHGDNHSAHHGNIYPSLGVITEEGNHKPHHGHSSPSESEHCGTLLNHDGEYKSHVIVYADCHASSQGLLAGMILMILTIVFIILLHVAVTIEEYRDTGIFIDHIFELTLLGVLTIATIMGYYQTSQLDINHHPISKLDDVLLLIAIPAFFSETIFSMLPAVLFPDYLKMALIMAQLVQILIQTPWIIDALRRCCNSVHLREKKPGRELVTFMTAANVAYWIYLTFSVKNVDVGDIRYEFYESLWSVLNHISLPLIMFYRFHASVCFVDIWKHSYEPGEFAH